jgi:hypothetical protein
MRSLIWILVCVLIPLVGTTYALRMILLSLLPERITNNPQLENATPTNN